MSIIPTLPIPATGSCGLVVTAVDLDPGAWSRLPAFFAEVEAAGGDTIWLTDHLFAGHPCAEPFVLAGVAAAATSRARIGTGVLQLALRRRAAVAKAASTLQLVSDGRFLLGVGAGLHRREFERAGIDFATRGAEIDRMLDGVASDWSVSDDWYSMRPTPPWPIPIWIGGTSAAAFRRVVAHGSGWLSIFQSPGRFADSNRRLSEALDDAGRAPGTVERRIVLFLCPTDGAWTREDALAWIARQFPGGPDAVGRHVITGSVADCVSEVRAFEQAGAHGVDLQITHPEPAPIFADLCRDLAATRS